MVTFSSYDWTTIFGCCVVRYGCKNRYQKDMCLEKLGVHAQLVLAILDSIIKIMGGVGKVGYMNI